MRFAVLSRHRAQRWVHDDKFIHISIRDPESKMCSLMDCSSRVGDLHLEFDDIEKQDYDKLGSQNEYVLFDERYARAILNFVNESLICYPDLDLIVVNCEAGISRSAGVAAALCRIFNGRDDAIFGDPALHPNMTVYQTILDYHFGKGSAFGEIEKS